MSAPTPEDVARNKRVGDRYNELMAEGKHGHYETMFRVVREEIERARAAAIEEAARWHPIETAPRDRYILLCDALAPRWDGNMEVGKWFGDDDKLACFWSPGGPNSGLELGRAFTHWRELPDDPAAIRALGEESAAPREEESAG